MNYHTITSLISLLLVTFLSSTLYSQTGSESKLVVDVGDTFEFEGSSLQELYKIDEDSASLAGIEETFEVDVLRVDSIIAEEVFWTSEMYVATGTDNSTLNSEAGFSGLPITMYMITDLEGQIKEVSFDTEEFGLGSDFMSMSFNDPSSQSKGPGWFLPSNAQYREVGEEWSSESTDTMSFDMGPNMDINFVIHTDMIYTYQGIVDTLGVSAVRLDWRTAAFSMDGGFGIPGEEGTSMTLSMKGTGDIQGVTYYSMEDRVQYAQLMENSLSVTVSGALAGEFNEQQVKVVQYTENIRHE